MGNRTYLWILFTLTLIMLMIVSAGLIYLYPAKESTPIIPVVELEPAPSAVTPPSETKDTILQTPLPEPVEEQVPAVTPPETVQIPEQIAEDKTVEPVEQETIKKEIPQDIPAETPEPVAKASAEVIDLDAVKKVPEEETTQVISEEPAEAAIVEAEAQIAEEPVEVEEAKAPLQPNTPRFWVVVGSYTTNNDAEYAQFKLGQQGFYGVIIVRSLSEYELRVGPYLSSNSAEEIANSIRTELDGFEVPGVKIEIPRN